MRHLLLPALLFTALQGSTQTLLTIGNDSISVAEFNEAFRKNNTGKETAEARSKYLELFIAAKLKVKEARSRGIDTTAQFRTDLEALRAQVLPAYLADPQKVQQLAEEANQRGQKDLQVAHIFIATANAADTAAAYVKAREAYTRLQSGAAFDKVAAQYSDDPSAKSNGGNLGYITAFSLPYELENLVYATPVGRLSAVYRSKAGYHIFKIVGERKAAGRIKAAQVMLAFPPDAPDAEKARLKQQADSIYKALQKGASFEALAERYSNDANSAGAGGLLPEFGVGQYDPVFEQAVFALAKDGAVAPPFVTGHGIHIVKRIARQPAVLSGSEKEAELERLRALVKQSDRMQSSLAQQAAQIRQRAGYQPLPANLQKALEVRTRQELNGQVPAEALSSDMVLFSLGGQPYTVANWLQFAQNNRAEGNGSDQPFEQLWNEYLQTQTLEHYQQHLEDYNPAFKKQMRELEEGNLFFEIMQQEVWTPAQNDTAALQQFYQSHKANYVWQRSADVALFFAPDKTTAEKLAAQIKQAPARWRSLASKLGADISTDSTRMEWSSITGSNKITFTPNQLTPIETNPADGTASFALILKTYSQPLQRSFEEAKGNVINDYQAEKEKQWVETLKQKYKVKPLSP
ncbi:peptidyl-prolyl cis-trans isomerase SurA [Cnuella takakiae]|uniref:Peptidyl-prolyl cis-trans isomerase SurA n=1 Tax=Cnuella takakiae TaxID=1302690 RepID=A0A1M5GUF1_9BACT|nr:peptidylprolyl isomerase [Cnuella takakiae]OLY90882.1 hypothetical protein BUE76_02465 [Cnuella takakiae]SHG07376.1 peptidyl-prolyl cis-trans isomerase SurA [Cnuella takakiae]